VARRASAEWGSREWRVRLLLQTQDPVPNRVQNLARDVNPGEVLRPSPKLRARVMLMTDIHTEIPHTLNEPVLGKLTETLHHKRMACGSYP